MDNPQMNMQPQIDESGFSQANPQPDDAGRNGFCTNCGSSLGINARFCAKCGKAVYSGATFSRNNESPLDAQELTETVIPDSDIPQTADTVVQISDLPPTSDNVIPNSEFRIPHSPGAPVDEPKTMRAVWVLAVGIFLMLLIMLLPIQFTSWILAFRLRDPLFALVLGFGFCIAYMERVSFKIIGSAGILLYALLYSVSQVLSINPGLDLSSIIAFPTFGRLLRQELICGLLLSAIAVCAGIWLRKFFRFWLTALIGAAVVIVINLVFNRTVFMMQDATTIIRVVFNCIAIPGFLFLASLLAHMTVGFKSRTVRISIGARVWCIIVFASMGLSLTANFFNDDRMIIFQSMLLIPTFAGMIFLSANKRIGFTLVLIGVGASVMNVYSLVWFMPLKMFLTYIGFAFGGIANVLITWFIIAKAWRGASVPVAYGAQYYAVPGYAPLYGAPQYGIPQYSAPQFGTQQYGAVQYNTPQYNAPQNSAPQYGIPQNSAPQSSAPQYGTPQSSAPQFGAPQSSVPQFSAQQYGAPQNSAPQFDAPQSSVPQFSAQQYGVPQNSAPQFGAQQYGALPYGAQGYSPQYGMPVYRVHEKTKLPAVFPVFSIIGSLPGLSLFFAGLISIITDGFYIQPFAFGILLGGAIAAVEIFATILFLKRRGRTGKALQIISLCITALIIISALIALAIYIVNY